jgi:multiple sugar transport system permease protein
MLGDVALAPWAIVIVDTWMWTPFVMLICLAGLRSIPDYIYEAAEMRPRLEMAAVLDDHRADGAALPDAGRAVPRDRELQDVRPRGAADRRRPRQRPPLLTSIDLKREAFEKWRTGYSSAYAVILFVTVFGLASIYVKALNKVKER